ncbi:hypothetical protein [Caballeronia sp. LZ034LL]|uniref:hypothetical protein n=1 Tax=Caballeronia sp. LZ034LL TaxID=3038567 RepID=UPI00286593FB|nr:hypothetical protein [Caballeronia sp. LZ034LL]MDR5835423.1 hypothetical protein [Caballeronia sp. LZ034LL]
MKKLALLAVSLCISVPSFAQYYGSQPSHSGYGNNGGLYGSDQQVSGYTRSNGTYVEPYHRTAPDNTMYNNYSSQGNLNPYTGQTGHVRPRY